jgi:hypothetical protein
VQARNKYTILLVFAPVYGDTSTGPYPKRYAPADGPCRRTQIRRNPVYLFLAGTLSKKTACFHGYPGDNLVIRLKNTQKGLLDEN